MRVQIVIHGLDIGGAESMTAHLARHLRQGGHRVEIDCLGELGCFGADLRAEGFTVSNHGRRAGFDPSLPARLAARVHRSGFDVVHLHQRTALFYGLLAGLLHAAPIVYTEHGFEEAAPRSRQRTFNRVFRRRLSRLTAVSRNLRDTLVADEGFDAGSIEVVPNAVDAARFAGRGDRRAVRAENELPIGGRLVATVGRLHAMKNQRVLIDVVARLKDDHADLAAVLIGDGPEEHRLRAHAERLGIADRVYFLGARRDVERLLPACDVFFLASRAEGTPVSMLEAMAARVPIVAAAVGGVPETAGHDREAILIEPPSGDDARASVADAYAAAVASLLSDSARAARLAEAAFRRVTADFSLPAMCARYEEVLTAAAGHRREAGAR